MINDFDDLLGALAVLELRGGDTTSIEAKTFSEYSPEQLGPTLSAFANKPGGGVILLACRSGMVSTSSASTTLTTC